MDIQIQSLSDIENFIDSLTEENQLEQYIFFKRLAELSEKAIEKLKKGAIEEAYSKAEVAGRKEFEYSNAMVTTKNGNSKYIYEMSPEWVQANVMYKNIESTKKSIEERLKKASEKNPFVDVITGEIITECKKIASDRTISIKLL